MEIFSLIKMQIYSISYFGLIFFFFKIRNVNFILYLSCMDTY